MSGISALSIIVVGIIFVAGIYFLLGGSGGSPHNSTVSIPRVTTKPSTTIPLMSNIPNYTTTINSTGPGGTGAFACPIQFYSLNGTVTSYNGFTRYYLNSSTSAHIADYVIHPNSAGTLQISEHVGSFLSQNSSNSTSYSRQHFMTLVVAGNSTSGFATTAPGVNATLSPLNYTATANATLNMTAMLNTNSTASGTYWATIDGPCAGGISPFLITIGTSVYNGSLQMPVRTFM